MLIVDGLDVSIPSKEYLDLLKAGGINCVHKSVGGLTSIGTFYDFLDQHSSVVERATTVGEIQRLHRQGKLVFVFGIQHANDLEALMEKTGSGVLTPLKALRAYYELGIRVLGIAYNVANVFGGGCIDHHIGLTRAGRHLVEEVHKLGIILDVGGHTGEQTSLDAIEMSEGVPIVCSHTNVAALNNNARATSNRVFEALARSGGVIGLTAISDYHVRNPRSAKLHGPVSPPASLETHLDQYDYLRKLVGVDHIGLGTDFTWGSGDGYVRFNQPYSLTFPPDVRSEGGIRYIKDFENSSHLPNLINGLRERGWSKEELGKLLSSNWLRVYKRVWGA